jgi:acetylornithine deacetylase/succinyl-diaminopimelate desuccinylase family protein
LKRKVLDNIDKSRDEIIELMQRLVQIPSPTGDEGEIGEFVLSEVKKHNLGDARIVQRMEGRPNVVARYKGTRGDLSLAVYAHYDTVPPGDLSNWMYGPYSGEIVDGKMYGRGVSDHKFPISPLLFATKAIRDAGIELKGDIVYAFVCDEEFGGHHGTKYLVDEGYLDTDMMLYSGGGGDGTRIGIASNGRQYFRITVKGRTAHTGRNDQGVNAATKAAKLILRLEELREEVNGRRDKFKAGDMEIAGKARLSINYVNAFVTGNNVPDRCIVQIDRRFIPQVETIEGCEAEIQEVIDELGKKDPNFKADMHRVPDKWMEPAWSYPDSPLIQSLQASAEKILGVKPSIADEVGGGSSDWGWYSWRYPERPVASYGCANGSYAHGYNEYITIDGLINNTKIYALLFTDLLGVEK